MKTAEALEYALGELWTLRGGEGDPGKQVQLDRSISYLEKLTAAKLKRDVRSSV